MRCSLLSYRLLLLHLCGLTSLGAPFFAPTAPRRSANPDGVLRSPVWKQRLRGMLAGPGNQLRVRSGPVRAWENREADRDR